MVSSMRAAAHAAAHGKQPTVQCGERQHAAFASSTSLRYGKHTASSRQSLTRHSHETAAGARGTCTRGARVAAWSGLRGCAPHRARWRSWTCRSGASRQKPGSTVAAHKHISMIRSRLRSRTMGYRRTWPAEAAARKERASNARGGCSAAC